jgi:hypothetical protein
MKNENKQAILDAFLFALWKTRAGYDIVDLQLTADQRTVVITYHTNGVRTETQLVNVEGDSGVTMIADICKAIS